MSNRYGNTSFQIDENNNRYYNTTLYPEISPNIDDVYILTQSGDRLDTLANTFYKDPSLWWVITKANPDKIRRDGFLIKPGIQIRIPSNIEKILIDFEKINKNK